ncbi:MAG: DUF4013 domain-containing protein [Thermoanaerobaculia bacterium]
MSEFGSFPPPPAPPAPPPPVSPGTSFDFLRPFTFVFQDPRWITKIAIGGLFYVAAFLIIGIFFIMGYCARLARNVIAGVPNPLPEWDDLGEYFGEGIGLFVISIAYMLPIVVIAAGIFIPAAIVAGSFDEEAIRNASGGAMSCAWCLIVPLSLVVSFFLPGGLLLAVVERRFTAAFEFGRLWNFIRGNFANYLLAFVVYLVARFAAPFGLILFCIGVVFTAFWAMVVAAYAFGQAYRLSPVK